MGGTTRPGVCFSAEMTEPSELRQKEILEICFTAILFAVFLAMTWQCIAWFNGTTGWSKKDFILESEVLQMLLMGDSGESWGCDS